MCYCEYSWLIEQSLSMILLADTFNTLCFLFPSSYCVVSQHHYVVISTTAKQQGLNAVPFCIRLYSASTIIYSWKHIFAYLSSVSFRFYIIQMVAVLQYYWYCYFESMLLRSMSILCVTMGVIIAWSGTIVWSASSLGSQFVRLSIFPFFLSYLLYFFFVSCLSFLCTFFSFLFFPFLFFFLLTNI